MKINFDKTGFPLVIPHAGGLFQWCCECGCRHVWTFEVIRGKTERDDEIYINCFRDENAEKLRRFYEKHKKEKKK